MAKNTGRVVEFDSSDGTVKNGIVYDKDQSEMLVGLKKALVTLVDEDYKPINTPRIIKNIDKLRYKGFVD